MSHVATVTNFYAWMNAQPYRNYLVNEEDFEFVRERVCLSGVLPRDTQGRRYIEFGEHRITREAPNPDLGPELDLVAAGRSILAEIRREYEDRERR